MFVDLSGFITDLDGQVSDTDTNQIVDVLPVFGSEGDHTFLVLRHRDRMEIIKATIQSGSISIDRGVGETTALSFPCGSTVSFEVTVPVVKALICNPDCYDCSDNQLAYAGAYVGDGTVGNVWSCTVIFSGVQPMHLGSNGHPTWCTVTVGPNYMTFEGTPTEAQDIEFSVAATNGSRGVASTVVTATISA